MRLDVVGDNLAERVIRRLNLAPIPLLHTHVALLLARTVMEAAKAGVFEALAAAPLVASELAARCQIDAAAAGKLLGALATSGYLTYDSSGSGRFALTPMARKWLLTSSPVSLHDKMLFTFDEGGLIDRMGDYLRTGKDVTEGGHLGAPRGEEFWRRYQRAMRAMASMSADEVARRTYVPAGAQTMLDVGGSHGLYSVAICRRHPGLSSTILDLPEAVAQSTPLLAKEGMGPRVIHKVGNVLVTDLGEGTYDVVFMSSLVHHFDEATNRELMKRIARALRPGGAVVVQDLVRRGSPTQGGQLGALLDLYFALTSQAGTWSVAEMTAWQRDAGLRTRAPVLLRSMPGGVQQAAIK
jgi:2-polyprenyl-3-methyl-5-hydroxy-6-metoxy-1,4-benzoquinol methylase